MHELKIKNTLYMLLGSAVFAFGLVHFNIANDLAEGGLTGVTLILYNLFNIDPAISNLVLNIPLFVIGWQLLGRTVFMYSLLGTVGLSFWLWVFQHHLRLNIVLEDDMTLAALFAGVFVGTGLGIIFRYGGTTGGTDIIARLAYNRFGWRIGQTMFLIDSIVITSSLVYINYRQAMYTLVAVFVAAQVIDFFQKGAYAAKAAMIVSKDNKRVAKHILEQMNRGATLLNGKGTFTNEQREVLYCVVSRNEIFRLKSVIKSIDPYAFVAVSDVHDVLGEGFTLDENKKPIND